MKANIFKRITTVILSATLTLILVGCGNTSSSEGSDSEKTSSKSGSSYEGLTIYVKSGSATEVISSIAFELGYFEDEFAADGVTVEPVVIQGGPAFLDAVSTDSADFGILGDQPLISGYASGKNVKIIGTGGDDTEGYRLIAGKNSEITTVADIKGKRVAATAGTTNEKALKTIMTAEGISENELEIVNLSEADSITALSTGDIDAALIYGSVVDSSIGDTVTTYSPYGQNVHAIGANTEFIEKYPELTARLLQVYDRTAQWINENKEESIKYISDLFDYTEEDAAYIYEREYFRIQYTEDDAAVLDSTARFLFESGIIDHEVSSDEFVDTQYIELAGLN